MERFRQWWIAVPASLAVTFVLMILSFSLDAHIACSTISNPEGNNDACDGAALVSLALNFVAAAFIEAPWMVMIALRWANGRRTSRQTLVAAGLAATTCAFLPILVITALLVLGWNFL